MNSEFLKKGAYSPDSYWHPVEEVRPGDTWLNPAPVFKVKDVRREGDEIVVVGPPGIVYRMDPEDEVAVQRRGKMAADVTESPAFKAWFGNSKVVDSAGKPLKVYHGTRNDFDVFSGNGNSLIFFTPDPAFADNYSSGSFEYVEGSKVMPVYLSIQDLFDYRTESSVAYDFWESTYIDSFSLDRLAADFYEVLEEELTDEQKEAYGPDEFHDQIEKGSWVAIEMPEFTHFLKQAGYDGIALLENGVVNFAVFSPNQIKSAIGNNGKFNPKNKKITASADDAILVIVHPGSACGSADMHYGKYRIAELYREGLISDMLNWNGGVVIIDGELSDELPEYPNLNAALTSALEKAKHAGKLAERRVGNDPDQIKVIRQIVKEFNIPKTTTFRVTGAWAYAGGKGCVGSVTRSLKGMGYIARTSEDALTGEDEFMKQKYGASISPEQQHALDRIAAAERVPGIGRSAGKECIRNFIDVLPIREGNLPEEVVEPLMRLNTAGKAQEMEAGAPDEDIDPNSLVTSQSILIVEKVKYFVMNPSEIYTGRTGFVYRTKEGMLFLEDGNHRASAALLLDRTVTLRVMDLGQA